jgi:hypothetical protein
VYPRRVVVLAYTVFGSMQILVLLGAWLAWKDNFLTEYQMKVVRKIPEGLPLLYHEPTWSDLVLIPLIVGLIISRHAGSWSCWAILVLSVVGVIASGGMHWTYLQSPILEAHIQYGRLTPSGIAHVVYMSIAFAVLLLYFFATPQIDPKEMDLISAALFAHVFFAHRHHFSYQRRI